MSETIAIPFSPLASFKELKNFTNLFLTASTLSECPVTSCSLVNENDDLYIGTSITLEASQPFTLRAKQNIIAGWTGNPIKVKCQTDGLYFQT